MEKLFPIVIACLFLICNATFAAMPSELVLYFSFDKGTVDGDTVKDLSQYGNDGSLHGDPKSGEGHIGEALDFTSDTVIIPTSESLAETASAITLEVWVFARAHKTQDIISKWDNAMNGIIHFEARDGGAMRFCMRNENDGTIADQTTASSFPVSTWTHIVETYDGEEAKVYFDAEEVGIAVGAGDMRQNDDCTFYIGSMYATDRWFDGLIDEVRIWNKALSPDEIKKAMEGSLVNAPVNLEGKLSSTWGSIKGF